MANTEEFKGEMDDQMMRSGLVSEPTDVDPVSGNEIPLGATAEGVRDDETAAISPGEFVIPDYAVRYHGIDFYMESLQTAKEGLDQMEQMGMVGNPDEQAMSDDIPLPTMDAEGSSPEFQAGGLTTKALPQVPQQQALPQVPTLTQPTVAGQATQPVTQPVSPALTQPLRPTTTQPIPVAPLFSRLQPQAATYRSAQGPAAGLPGGYRVEEYVDANGNKIFLTEIGGKVTGGVPQGFRRARGDGSIGVPGTIAPRQPSGFELPEIGDTAKGAATALGALTAFNTVNKATGGAIGDGLVSVIKAAPGGEAVIEAIKNVNGNVGEFVSGAITDLTSKVSQSLGITSAPATQTAAVADTIAGGVGGQFGGTPTLDSVIPSSITDLSKPHTAESVSMLADAQFADPSLAKQNLANISGFETGSGGYTTVGNFSAPSVSGEALEFANMMNQVGVPPTSPAPIGGGTGLSGTEAQAAIDKLANQAGSGTTGANVAATVPAITSNFQAANAILSSAGAGSVGAATEALGPVAFEIAKTSGLIGPGGAFLGGTPSTSAIAAGIAPSLAASLGIGAAILAIPTVANILNPGSSNRALAGRQATSKVQELLLNPDFNETNAQRIRALVGLKGDKGKYGEVPSEGQVPNIGFAIGRLTPEDIPNPAAREIFNQLIQEQDRRRVEAMRQSFGVGEENEALSRRLTPEQVKAEFRRRQTDPDILGGGE